MQISIKKLFQYHLRICLTIFNYAKVTISTLNFLINGPIKLVRYKIISSNLK